MRWSGLRGALAAALALAAQPAFALFHTWDIDEIYSNADGTIQFIELREAEQADDQTILTLAKVTSTASTFLFPSDLEDHDTSAKRLLLGTAAYAAAPGAVAPDFVIPANFFSTSGDTLRFATTSNFVYDTFVFGPGALPTDGLQSLSRAGVAANSPTNSAGQTGSLVPEPGTGLLLAAGLLGLAWSARPGRTRARRE
jgi:hypothetical protein